MFVLENIITLVVGTWSDIEAGNCGHSSDKQKPVGGGGNGQSIVVPWVL